MITLENVNFIYNAGNPFEKYALRDINVTIHRGEFIGLIGHTGSGKSTLVQHLNGLMKPTSGKVIVGDIVTTDADAAKRGLRQKWGSSFNTPSISCLKKPLKKTSPSDRRTWVFRKKKQPSA